MRLLNLTRTQKSLASKVITEAIVELDKKETKEITLNVNPYIRKNIFLDDGSILVNAYLCSFEQHFNINTICHFICDDCVGEDELEYRWEWFNGLIV